MNVGFRNNFINEVENEEFWKVDLDYKLILVERLSQEDGELELRLLAGEGGRLLKNSPTYNRHIREFEQIIADGVSRQSIQKEPPNVASQVYRHRGVPSGKGNPWSFEYTRWYSDLVEELTARLTEEFYAGQNLSVFLVNGGVSAFGLGVNLIDDYFASIGVMPIWFAPPSTYGECQDLLVGHYRKIGQVVRSFLIEEDMRRLVLIEAAFRPVFLIDFDGSQRCRKEIEKVVNLADLNPIVVFDATRCPDYFSEDIEKDFSIPNNVVIIRFQSLTKYHYAGLATGRSGILVAPKKFVDNIQLENGYSGKKAVMYRRALQGSILEPYQCLLLPPPSKEYMRGKIEKHNTNAAELQSLLGKFQCRYGILSFNPETGATVDNQVVRQGSGVFITLRRGEMLEDLVFTIINDLGRRGIYTEERGSFGFSCTTFDVWGHKTLRISTGIESLEEAKEVRECVLKHLKWFSR